MAPQSTAVLTIAALAAALLSQGCSVLAGFGKRYPGPDLPSDQVAIVKGQYDWNWWRGPRSVHIMAIDGDVHNVWKRRAVEAKLAPGAHAVEIGFQSGDLFSPEGILLTFNAEAGHVYEIHAARVERRHRGVADVAGEIVLGGFGVAGKWTGWLVDKQTGAVVTGKMPPKCEELGPEEHALCWSSEL